MAGRSSKKTQTTPPPKAFDEFDDDADAEGFDDEAAGLEPKEPTPATRSRDWRDVERLRELRELRKLVGDDLDDLLEDVIPGAVKKPRGK